MWEVKKEQIYFMHLSFIQGIPSIIQSIGHPGGHVTFTSNILYNTNMHVDKNPYLQIKTRSKLTR